MRGIPDGPGPDAAGKQEDPFAFERGLVDMARMWRVCDLPVCRRAQRCAPPEMPCEPRHREDIRAWFRTVYIPWLRKRWPTVHWGAPASQVEREYEAALAAEAAGAGQPGRNRRQGRKRRRARSRRTFAAAS